MKIISVVVFLLLVVTSSASAQWKKDGKLAADSADRKAVNGFGCALLVVENPREFIEEWKKPEIPSITTATKVKRGDSLGAFILFAGCKPDSHGDCNAEVDYMIYKPDGSLYAERKGEPLWKQEAPPANITQLSTAILGFRLEPNDPAGEYKVKAKVSDLNAEISYELETNFLLK